VHLELRSAFSDQLLAEEVSFDGNHGVVVERSVQITPEFGGVD